MKTFFYEIREELGLSLEEMALLAGVSIYTIYSLEAGNLAKINANVKDLLIRLGYDTEVIEETYHYERQQKAEQLFKDRIIKKS